ncbi:MAG TPA: protein kinase, partial [Gemmatimonadaceae bacterium]|nr:protein kinase [Gemmatimonadaceae bacterium]
AGALHAYDAFARRLADEYGAEPAAETRALMARIRQRSAPAAPASVSATNGAGDALDGWQVERELGRGGMATVYLAEELKHGRPVAIKVLRPELSAALGTTRFLREIGIAARLSHPHLVPLIDSGEEAGVLYYVSSFVAGGSLRDRLRAEGRLPVDEALRVAGEVGSALDYAHREGFVHRDVKPENILFADGHALLTDFGVARAAYERASVEDDDAAAVTSPGLAVGTPEYMSPEQASGERDLDARSDIYSFACVVFEMLTGAPPFTGGPAISILARHVTDPAPSVRLVRPEAGAAVEGALARALAKDPAHRFATVADFVAALTADVPPRGRTVASAARGIAVLPFVNASPEPDNEYLSDGITDELIDALAKVEGLRVASRTSVFALKGKPQDVRAIGALLDCAYVLEGTVRRAGARLRITAQLSSTADGSLLWSQRYDRTLEDVFEIQDEIARTIVGTLRATSLSGLPQPAPQPHRQPRSVRAYRLYLKGRYEWNRRSRAGVVAGIRYFREAIAEDPEYALAWTGLADCYSLQADYRDIPVAEGFRAAEEYARRAIELDDTLAEAHSSLAWCLFVYDWDWEGAAREFRRAIELEPLYATAHQWYAFYLHSRGAIDEALVEGHTAVELDPGSVSARRSLGNGYYYARRYDQARYHLDRAIAMNPNAEESYRVLGLVLAMDGRVDDALQVLQEAVAMPEGSTYTSATLAFALARAGRDAEARRILARLEARARSEYVSPVAFATIHLGLGDAERALDWTERAREDRRGWLAYLTVNPIFDPVRDHPRFTALVRRMGL